MRSLVLPGIAIAVLTILNSCLSPITLDRAVMAYDDVADRIVTQQLLLNIARARHHQPIHFTGVSGIVATFNYNVTAGVVPPYTTAKGNLIGPSLSTTVSENPTFSIIPIEGEEFTRRLLMPIPESRLTMLLRQGADIGLALRLMASEFRRTSPGTEIIFNRPGHHGYESFRQLVLHLSSIQGGQGLYMEPLHFRQEWDFSKDSITPGNLATLLQTFSVDYDPKKRLYHLSQPSTGRIVITNYNPDDLSNRERLLLNQEAERSAPDELMLDIRPDREGKESPLRGRFRIRSFRNVLDFIARGIADEPEYDVEPDSRTPGVHSPVRTLDIIESDSPIRAADATVNYNGQYYAVRTDRESDWNREAFRMLAQLFQMTVTDLPQSTTPGISISK